jgi:hypothetical protein
MWDLRFSQRSSEIAPYRPYVPNLVFDPEDGGDTFLRNVGSHTDYATIYQATGTFIIADIITQNA